MGKSGHSHSLLSLFGWEWKGCCYLPLELLQKTFFNPLSTVFFSGARDLLRQMKCSYNLGTHIAHIHMCKKTHPHTYIHRIWGIFIPHSLFLKIVICCSGFQNSAVSKFMALFALIIHICISIYIYMCVCVFACYYIFIKNI